MARLCGASCGLLIFSAMVLRGLIVGNPPDVILMRALIGLFAGVLMGSIAGLIGQVVVRQKLPVSQESQRDEPQAASTRMIS